jgi:hypothetical protein
MFIILVSYRARGVQEFRRKQLMEALNNFRRFFEDRNVEYKIVVIEQNNDNKFNRGLLLNAAFLESEKLFTFPKKYIHMNADYTFNLSNDFPEDFFNVNGFLDLYRSQWPVLGAACVFDPDSYKEINGFPNDLQGWGGDDWAIYNRIMTRKINLFTNKLFNSGFIIDHHVHFMNDITNNDKNIELANRNDIENNGLTTLEYKVDGNGEFHGGNVFHYLINFD